MMPRTLEKKGGMNKEETRDKRKRGRKRQIKKNVYARWEAGTDG